MLSYLAVLLFFTLSLMAKPMLVTLPFLMLLLDYWPLRRTSFKFQVSGFKFLNLKPETLKPETDFNQPGTRNQKLETRNLFFEKLPLFALAALSGVITFIAQQKGGTVRTLEHIPIGIRVENALVSYIDYLIKMLRPQNLAVFYPHPGNTLPLWQAAGSALLLLTLSLWSLRQAKRRPYLIIGWLWYLGTLLPVIGIAQVGFQAMADRYTYLPLIGIFMMIAWGAEELETRNLKPETFRTVFLGGIAGVTLVLLAAAARVQVGYWKDGVTLFEHATRVTERNRTAHNNLGYALAKQGRIEEAISHYSTALSIDPNFEVAHNNLGYALLQLGKTEEAIAEFTEASRINPDRFEPHYNLAVILANQGRSEEAIRHFAEAIRIKPDHFEAHNRLGATLARQGKLDEAIQQFSEAIRIDPDSEAAHGNLAAVLAKQGKLEK